MEAINPKKKNKNEEILDTILFLAVTTITAVVVLVAALESHRIKRENELLEYEVW